jgi:phosphopantetheine--protein transferase-like protein
VGIDIEKFREKILKIYKKFISEKEYEIFNKECIESLTKAWSIKESVYKAFGHNGIDFKKNIKIQSLNKNKAFVLINKSEKIEKYNVDLFKISNYICSLAHLKK